MVWSLDIWEEEKYPRETGKVRARLEGRFLDILPALLAGRSSPPRWSPTRERLWTTVMWTLEEGLSRRRAYSYHVAVK